MKKRTILLFVFYLSITTTIDAKTCKCQEGITKYEYQTTTDNDTCASPGAGTRFATKFDYRPLPGGGYSVSRMNVPIQEALTFCGF